MAALAETKRERTPEEIARHEAMAALRAQMHQLVDNKTDVMYASAHGSGVRFDETKAQVDAVRKAPEQHIPEYAKLKAQYDRIRTEDDTEAEKAFEARLAVRGIVLKDKA